MDAQTVSKTAVIIVICCLLAACGERGHDDLRVFMDKVVRQSAGAVEPLPAFRPDQTFLYSAIAFRSPFEKPLSVVVEADGVSGVATIRPNPARKKEYLESFEFSAFTLVGILEQGGASWSLIDDGDGGVHSVSVGSYIGKDHGRVHGVSEGRLDVVEIIPDGRGGWAERPRTLALRGGD